MTDHSKNHVVAAVYGSHKEAEATISKIQRSRLDRRDLSTAAGERTGRHSLGYCAGRGPMVYWGEEGPFWDDFWRMLHGSEFYFIPGFGSLLVGGPIFASILNALELGLSALASRGADGRPPDMGPPGDKATRYENALERGRYLVIAEIGCGDTSNAQEIIVSTAPMFWANYPAGILREAAISQ